MPAGLAAVSDNDLDQLDIDVCGDQPTSKWVDRPWTSRAGAGGGIHAVGHGYQQSTDARINDSDEEVKTGAVGALAPAATSIQSISLTAPPTIGTCHHGG